MNSKENSTTAAGGASILDARALTHALAETDFTKLSGFELWAMYDALHTLNNVLCGFLAQPRFGREDGNDYNCAGVLLAGIGEWLCRLETATATVAKARPDTGAPRDTEYKLWAIVQYEANMTDDLGDLAVIVSDAARREVRSMAAGRAVA